VDSCEHGDGPADSIKGREFPDWLSDFVSQGLWSGELVSNP